MKKVVDFHPTLCDIARMEVTTRRPRLTKQKRNIMQTIETKYIGATNCKGSRIKATHEGNAKTITTGYNHALNLDENHQDAARQLMHGLKWDGEMHGGTTKTGMAWVFVNNGGLVIKGKTPAAREQ